MRDTSPADIKAIGAPLNASGIFAFSRDSLILDIIIRANRKPTPAENP